MALVATPTLLHAQPADHVRRPASTAELIGGNMLAGGLTAATRAMLTGKDPFRAFGVGALGGLVHLAGKRVAVHPGAANGWLGLGIAATGTSIVSNAGRAVTPLDEITIPLLAVKLRVTPRAERKVAVAVSAFETAMLVQGFASSALEVEWARTAHSGALVFVTKDRRIVSESVGDVNGFAASPVIVIGAFVFDQNQTMRHETVHVHQLWFMHEAWGRPIENYVRSKIGVARYLPSWLEIGLASPLLTEMARQASPDTDVRRLLEAEAEGLERP